MIPDPKWLDALKLPLNVTVAVALATSVLFALEIWSVLDLGPVGAYVRPALIVIGVVFWTLTAVNLIDYLLAPVREKRRRKALSVRRAIRRKEEEEQREEKRKQILARLDHLSNEEIRYVVECFRNESPTFYTYAYHGPVTMLLGKGLVWTPGGQHNEDHYPFSFYDFVWDILITRKDEFIAKHEEHKRAEEARGEAERRRRY